MRLQGFTRTLFTPGQRLCCALSGGADSTALLLALLEGNAEKDSLGVVLSALHIHHGLRGAEADADTAFVQALCATHQVPLTVLHLDTPTRRQDTGEGLEEAARELRYAAFRDLLSSGTADALATAHTLDDQAETVLMKLLRGAWTDGLAGIAPVLPLRDLPASGSGSPALTPQPPATGSRQSPGLARHLPGPQPHSPAILRPLLAVSRSEVERFLRERHQPWQTDSTNADLSFTRNRVRHQLLPLLETFNPSIRETLARTAGIARDEELFWQAEVARLLPGLTLPGKPVRGGGRAVSTAVGDRSVALELERLKSHPPALRRRLLRAACRDLGCRPGAEETSRLLSLAGLTEAPGLTPRNGARLELSGGLRAERSLRELRLSRSGTDQPPIPKKT